MALAERIREDSRACRRPAASVSIAPPESPKEETVNEGRSQLEANAEDQPPSAKQSRHSISRVLSIDLSLLAHICSPVWVPLRLLRERHVRVRTGI